MQSLTTDPRQVRRHRAVQGREPSVLHYLQLLRFETFRHRHQDRFLRPDRKEKKDAGLSDNNQITTPRTRNEKRVGEVFLLRYLRPLAYSCLVDMTFAGPGSVHCGIHGCGAPGGQWIDGTIEKIGVSTLKNWYGSRAVMSNLLMTLVFFFFGIF